MLLFRVWLVCKKGRGPVHGGAAAPTCTHHACTTHILGIALGFLGYDIDYMGGSRLRIHLLSQDKPLLRSKRFWDLLRQFAKGFQTLSWQACVTLCRGSKVDTVSCSFATLCQDHAWFIPLPVIFWNKNQENMRHDLAWPTVTNRDQPWPKRNAPIVK